MPFELKSSCEICDALEAENILLMNKVKTLEKELIETKNFFNKLSSDHLKNLLGVHQPSKKCDSVGVYTCLYVYE